MNKSLEVPSDLPSHNNLSVFRLLAFSSPAVAVAMLWVPIGTYLPAYYATEYATEAGSMSLYWVGVVFMLVRLWDGITDPLIGRLSDITKSRFGKRRIWILGGVIPLMISIHFLFNAPVDSGKTYLFIWASLFYLSWTLIQVPYLSWGAELSSGYNGRSRVFGFRETGTAIGILLSAALPLLVLGGDAKMSEILQLLSWVLIFLLPLMVGTALFFVGEREQPRESSPKLKGSLITALKTNRPYRRFLLFCLLFFTGISIGNAAFVLLIQYRLELPNAVTAIIFVLYITTIIGVSLWTRIARHIGRHRVLGVAVVGSMASHILLAFVPAGSYGFTFACIAFLGIFNAAYAPMCGAIIGDLTDFGNLKGHGEQTGSYMAGYYLVLKLGIALGIGIGFPLLQYLGFDASVGTAAGNSKAVMIAYSVIPTLIISPCIFLVWNFPIDARRHAIIRRWLARRQRVCGIEAVAVGKKASNGAKQYQYGVGR